MLLFGPADELGEPVPGVEIVDAPVSIAKAEDPVRAARTTHEASIVQAARAVAQGRAQALVCAGAHRRRARGGHPQHQARARYLSPRASDPTAGPRAPGDAAGRRCERRCAQGAPRAVRVHGRRARPHRPWDQRAAGRPAVQRRGARARQRARARGARRAARARRRRLAGIRVHRQRRGWRRRVRPRRCDRHRRLHRQHRSEADGGRLADDARRDRDRRRCPRRRRSSAALLLRGALRGFRDEIDPEANGGAYLLGLRRLGVVPHGRFKRAGFANAILRADRGAREDIVAQTHAALEQAGALKRSPVSASGASLPQAQ